MVIFEGEEPTVLKDVIKDIHFDGVKNDMVNHPKHYQIDPPIDEVMKLIELLTKNMKGVKAFHFGNWIKYVFRAGKKDKSKENEDLEKANYYLKLFAKEVLRSENDRS